MQNKYRITQFLPFDGLKGFKEQIALKEKIVVSKKDLNEDELETLNYKIKQIKNNMMVKIILFDNENYIVKQGLVTKIDFENKYIKIVKDKIDFASIVKIESDMIKELY